MQGGKARAATSVIQIQGVTRLATPYAGGVPRPASLIAEHKSQWQPPPPLLKPDSPPATPFLGQVAGVAKGHNGTVWVFHRGDRVWDGASFTGPKAEHVTYTEPIAHKTVLQLDQDTGKPACSSLAKVLCL